MFRKKGKKQQGVLNVEDEAQPQRQKIENQSILAINGVHQKDAGNKHKQGAYPKGLQITSNPQDNSKTNVKAEEQVNGSKRGKNFEHSYTEDAKQQLQNEPKKRVKQHIPTAKQKHLISNNTYERNQQIGEAVHESFEGINYKAGKHLIKDMELEADQLEQQLAKKKFLENVQTTRLIKQGKLNTKIYRGMNSYANHKLTNNDIENAEESYKKKMGPSRVNSTIKNGCRFDYVLNLCKDWHDSGYCPFGNSCLYLHDRSNHKTGWQLEKDFEQAQKQRWRRINNPQLAQKQDREKLLKTIQKYKPQQLCTFCSKSLTNPVQMQCGHIFCTPCAIKLTKCKQCGKRLSGIMNEAKGKLQKQKKDYQEMVLRLESKEQEIQTQRRKFQNTDSLDVFND